MLSVGPGCAECVMGVCFVVCEAFNLLLFCEVFCDYGGVYCCAVGVYVLLYNGVWVSVLLVCVMGVI